VEKGVAAGVSALDLLPSRPLCCKPPSCPGAGLGRIHTTHHTITIFVALVACCSPATEELQAYRPSTTGRDRNQLLPTPGRGSCSRRNSMDVGPRIPYRPDTMRGRQGLLPAISYWRARVAATPTAHWVTKRLGLRGTSLGCRRAPTRTLDMGYHSCRSQASGKQAPFQSGTSLLT
jgi:hypothetical protein